MIQIGVTALLLLMAWLCPVQPATVQVKDSSIVLVNDIEYLCEECNPLVLGQRIDINEASAEILLHLPSIGEKRAQQIVEWRNNNGEFRELVELQKIKGIGPKTVLKIQPYISFQ